MRARAGKENTLEKGCEQGRYPTIEQNYKWRHDEVVTQLMLTHTLRGTNSDASHMRLAYVSGSGG